MSYYALYASYTPYMSNPIQVVAYNDMGHFMMRTVPDSAITLSNQLYSLVFKDIDTIYSQDGGCHYHPKNGLKSKQYNLNGQKYVVDLTKLS